MPGSASASAIHCPSVTPDAVVPEAMDSTFLLGHRAVTPSILRSVCIPASVDALSDFSPPARVATPSEFPSGESRPSRRCEKLLSSSDDPEPDGRR